MSIYIESFPHQVEPTISIATLEKLYSHKGYSFYYKLIEHLIIADGHCIDCSIKTNLDILSKSMDLTTDEILGMINVLIFTKELDRELWEEHRIIWLNSLQDMIGSNYGKRRAAYPLKPLEAPPEPKMTDDELSEARKMEVVEVVERWNEFFTGTNVAKISKLTKDRERKLRKRMSEGFDIDKVLDAIAKQPFLQGQSARGWVVNFDYIIANTTNWVKVTELGFLSPEMRKMPTNRPRVDGQVSIPKEDSLFKYANSKDDREE